MKKNIFSSSGKDTENHWASISDMMSGLMIIFLFISIAYMNSITKEKDKIEEVAVTWSNLHEALYQELWKEFKDDLNEWKAFIDRDTLSVRFNEPKVFFKEGSAALTNDFKKILNNFFPRYIKVLRMPDYEESIEEVRIEGHTSSEWYKGVNALDAYFKNMGLSQDRTREVLEYCLREIPSIERHREWAISNITANGLSSSKLIRNSDGSENKDLSRRVEFRVRTKTEEQMKKILGDR